ncbi:hypothetical protein RRG08_016394 [Elysia crispata]|uniref:Uncharacterized protein n=1 Tax=Elysia crispata TaxID=231223 RepID=A0AAE0YAA9_9GAST|nr:hypothetical protein RRG08_016394 [Elysia crispata]
MEHKGKGSKIIIVSGESVPPQSEKNAKILCIHNRTMVNQTKKFPGNCLLITFHIMFCFSPEPSTLQTCCSASFIIIVTSTGLDLPTSHSRPPASSPPTHTHTFLVLVEIAWTPDGRIGNDS